ncbi:C39 family peptidase [Latilactobacillus sakei]
MKLKKKHRLRLLGILLMAGIGLLMVQAQFGKPLLKIQNAQSAQDITKKPKKVLLDIAPISQFPELPTGREITAVAMLMTYKDIDLPKTAIPELIPYTTTGDMETGFWGNPFDDSGYTMYPPAWADLFDQYLGSFTDLSNASVSTLKKTLDHKKPIVAWINYHGQPAHSVLIVGYDQEHFYFNDPYTGKRKKMTFKAFWKIASYQGHRAMTY